MIISEPYIQAKIQVQSKSIPGEFHIVNVWSDGKTECDCVAGLYHRYCKHQMQVKEQLKLKTYDENSDSQGMPPVVE